MSRVLAGRGQAVMAAAATAQHLCMINAIGWRKRDRVMTVLTDIGRLNMRRILAGRVGTVVATRAIARDVDVVEVGRYPA